MIASGIGVTPGMYDDIVADECYNYIRGGTKIRQADWSVPGNRKRKSAAGVLKMNRRYEQLWSLQI